MRRYLGDTISRTFASSSNRSRTTRAAPARDSAEWRSAAAMRQHDDAPAGDDDGDAKQPFPRHVEVKPSTDTLDERGNFYHEDSATPSTHSDAERPIRSAEDYEAYAMRQLSRHAYHRSLSTNESAGQDWGDPRRRYEADNAV